MRALRQGTLVQGGRRAWQLLKDGFHQVQDAVRAILQIPQLDEVGPASLGAAHATRPQQPRQCLMLLWTREKRMNKTCCVQHSVCDHPATD